MNPFQLPAGTHIGHAHLQVSSLDKTLPFYVNLLGFKPIHVTEEPDQRSFYLSSNGEHPAHIIITERPGARPAPPNTSGLFHLAIRLPGRKALAQLFQHLVASDYPFQGFSDHGVSEALYLADPEGNGLELYRDRPRDQWPTDGDHIAMRTDPLDVRDLLAEAQDQAATWGGIHPQSDIGHVHLKVSDLTEAEDFYHGLIGLDVTQHTYSGALFFSAGGYHHHIGTNTWASRGGSPSPEGAIGLVSFSLRFASGDAWSSLINRLQGSSVEIEEWIEDGHLLSALIRDPFDNGLLLAVDRTQVGKEILRRFGLDKGSSSEA